MRKHLFGMISALALGFGMANAHAATVTIEGSTSSPSGNDFLGEFSAAFGGLAPVFLDSPTFTANSALKLIFTAVAAESGYNNTFTTDFGTLSENGDFGGGTDFKTSNGQGSVSGTVGAGVIDTTGSDALFKFTSDGSFADTSKWWGQALLGVYLPNGSLSGDSHNMFFLAFDDKGAGPDDNHDDYIIRVDVAPIPIPAALPLFMAGLGMFGWLGWRKRGGALPA